jgi:hypothetical protein
MSKLILAVTILAIPTGALFCAEPDNNNGRAPVLLELFTSEGCSSCPPADRLLAVLDRTQPIAGAEVIVLSEHVDYWNYLGWTDPFSSEQFSARQSAYASKFHLDGVYTPQLVVDGIEQFVGSDGREAVSAIEKEARQQKIGVTISNVVHTGNRITAQIEIVAPQHWPGGQAAVLYLALAENEAESRVARGENAGQSLAHVAVVRSLTQVGAIRLQSSFTKEVSLSASVPGTNGLRLVAFLQDPDSGHILGAALRKLQ